MFNKILAAIDGSPNSEKALATGVDLAAHYQAELIALSVAEMPEVVAMVDEVDEIRQSAEAFSARSRRPPSSMRRAAAWPCGRWWSTAMRRKKFCVLRRTRR